MKITWYIWLVLLAANYQPLFASYRDVQVLRSNRQQLHIRYTPGPLILSEREEAGVTYTALQVHGCSYTGQTGGPRLPVRTLVVGIPWEGGCTIHAESEDRLAYTVKTVLPIPRVTGTGLQAREVYAPDPSLYSQDGQYPAQLFATDTSLVRHQRVVTLYLYPVQYNPVRNSVRYLTGISIRISFQGGDKTRLVPPDRAYESLYRKLILNYETARGWRYRLPGQRYKQSAEPGAGQWFRFPVKQEGIYRLDYGVLIKAGIAAPSAATLHLYTGSGRELSPSGVTETTVFPRDPLQQVPLYCTTSGALGTGDYFLFYGQGLTGWEYDTTLQVYSYYKNHFSDENVYWLQVDAQTPAQPWGLLAEAKAPATTITQGEAPLHFEEDNHFLYDRIEGSGKPYGEYTEWFWERLTNAEPVSILTGFSLPNLDTSRTARLFIDLAQMGIPNQTRVYVNNTSAGTGGTSTISLTGKWFKEEDNTLKLAGEYKWLDWFDIYYSRFLQAEEGQLTFGGDTTGTVEYRLTGFGSQTVWICDVTDQYAVTGLKRTPLGDTLGLTVAQDGYRRFFACTPETWQEVPGLKPAQPGKLLTAGPADYLVLVPDEWSATAAELARFREQANPDIRQALVVRLSEIFDSFSAGRYDPTAIRDFLVYTAFHWVRAPAYTVLVGDGHYDFKHIRANQSAADSRNWFPVYLNRDSGFCADDWFVRAQSGRLLSIGRLPVHSSAELAGLIKKITEYESGPSQGRGWRNRFVLVGDDEVNPDGPNYSETYHIGEHAESIASLIPGHFSLTKIYLTEYERDILGKKPEANEDFIEAFNQGALVVDYIGHGAPDIIAHESVFRYSTDFRKIQNYGRYPIFFAASCDVGKFDDYNMLSMGEGLCLAPGRGAIATVTATRRTVGHNNHLLNYKFIDNLLNDHTITTVGIALHLARDPTNPDHRYYVLQGDPALQVTAPAYQVVIDTMVPESLTALALVRITGYIEKDGAVWTDYTGEVYLEVFDADKQITYISERGVVLPYQLPGTHLFRGTADVEQGRFSVTFMVPKDISYQRSGGRISAYVYSAAGEGIGFQDSIFIGGTAAVSGQDQDGPVLALALQNYEPEDYQYVSPAPTLLVRLEDPSGINITGGVGHAIQLTLDGDPELTADLTAQFEYDKNSHTRGALAHTLYGLRPGPHRLSVKAWDNQNNSSEEELAFTVVDERDFRVLNPLNYPNPFSYKHQGTRISYTLNLEANDGVIVKIYTVSGRLIRRLGAAGRERGYNVVYWDGADSEGSWLANGTYLYVVVAKRSYYDGLTKKEVVARATGYAVIMR